MARFGTSRKGAALRYFEVTYTPAEKAAHNGAVEDMVTRGVGSYRFFSGGPAAGGRTALSFGIPEEEADAYVRLIRAAGRKARAGVKASAGEMVPSA